MTSAHFIGWGIGIRTPTNRVRVCRATVTLFPNVTRVWATDIYYTQFIGKVNTFLKKIFNFFSTKLSVQKLVLCCCNQHSQN